MEWLRTTSTGVAVSVGLVGLVSTAGGAIGSSAVVAVRLDAHERALEQIVDRTTELRVSVLQDRYLRTDHEKWRQSEFLPLVRDVRELEIESARRLNVSP